VSTVPSVGRDRPADMVAGFLAAVAIFGGVIAIAVRPVPIGIFSIFVGLLGAALAERNERLAAIGVAVAGSGFLAGMIICAITSRPLW
jgi:hypothetical protein